MDWRERIVVDPEVLVGKPVIKGTRLAVEFVLGLLATGWSEQQILDNYPVESADVRACFAYAQELLREEHMIPLRA